MFEGFMAQKCDKVSILTIKISSFSHHLHIETIYEMLASDMIMIIYSTNENQVSEAIGQSEAEKLLSLSCRFQQHAMGNTNSFLFQVIQIFQGVLFCCHTTCKPIISFKINVPVPNKARNIETKDFNLITNFLLQERRISENCSQVGRKVSSSNLMQTSELYHSGLMGGGRYSCPAPRRCGKTQWPRTNILGYRSQIIFLTATRDLWSLMTVRLQCFKYRVIDACRCAFNTCHTI